jgi:hypothetical protein
MQLINGKTYNTNSKRSPVITIIDLPGSKDHPHVGIDHKRRLFTYQSNGHFINSEFKHEMDIINEY